MFGSKTAGATLGTYNQVQSGYYYDAIQKKFYVGSDNNGTELEWDATTSTFKEQNNQTTTHSLKQVYGISNGMVEKIKMVRKQL